MAETFLGRFRKLWSGNGTTDSPDKAKKMNSRKKK